jgi:hypothetical protein
MRPAPALALEELGPASGQAERDRAPERVADDVRRRRTERLDQACKVVLVVVTRPGLGAVLAACMPAAVVADHTETPREILLDERPRLPVVPASVDKKDGIPAPRLLHEQPYAIDLEERHCDRLTSGRPIPPACCSEPSRFTDPARLTWRPSSSKATHLISP